ncbi:hypothetical protein JZU51_00425, partial [bacterium]|nr:hypothetical protein [bacterium]
FSSQQSRSPSLLIEHVLSIDNLAAQPSMSSSTFHHHFRSMMRVFKIICANDFPCFKSSAISAFT